MNLLLKLVLAVAIGCSCVAAVAPRKLHDGQYSYTAWEPSAGNPFWRNGLAHGPLVGLHDVWISFETFGEPSLNSSYVRFALAFNTSGWVGFGPSDSGSMRGGNPMVVREDPVGSGNFRCIAMHSEVNGMPIENVDQNCELLEIYRANGETYVLIQRPTVGCMPGTEDVNIVKEWELRFIYAFGPSQTFSYHGATRSTIGFSPVYGQYGYPGETCPLPADTIYLEPRISDAPWEIPAYRDVYFCRQYRFPEDKRYHLVQFDILTFDIAPATYHHYILYDCPSGLPNRDDWMEPHQCPGAGGTAGCFRFWTGWAAGQQPWCNNVQGQAIGAGENAVVQVFQESHIDNPNSDSGLYDPGWGLKLWITATISPQEQLVYGLYIGFPPRGLPPLTPSYVLAGAYGGGCTSEIPATGFYISSVTPHMHGLGTSVSLLRRRASNPNITDVIYNQNTWDFNWQGPRMFPPAEHVRIYPGDTLIGHCDFDTSNKTTPTYFGEGFEDEMCIFFISYYDVDASYPLTMVYTGALQMISPGQYDTEVGYCGCNAPAYSGMYDLRNMSLPNPELSQCH